MMRQYAAPSDFFANAESGLIFPNLRNALYKGTLVANDATALANEFNRAVPSTLVIGVGKTISSLTSAGTTVTVVTATAHGMATGRVVTVAGCTPAAYNGDYSITVVNTTTFTYIAGSAPGVATVIGTYSPHPVYAADSVTLTGNAASPNAGINTGIVTSGDVMACVLTQKTGAMGIFSASLAASNSNIIGFQGTTTEIQFHDGNSSGAAAKLAWPADIGTKKLFAAGWGRVHGFPFMVAGLNGVLSAVQVGTVAGGDRVPAAGDHVWYWARPNGGNGAGTVTTGAIFGRVDDEDLMLAEILTAYLNVRQQWPGTVY